MCWRKKPLQILCDGSYANGPCRSKFHSCIPPIIQCFSSMNAYTYKQPDNSYSPEFGVFALFGLFSFLYALFVGFLFLFHFFLILTNRTTTELVSPGKLRYMRGLIGNPFSRGIINNLLFSITIPEGGR
jgi:hypothetical protein